MNTESSTSTSRTSSPRSKPQLALASLDHNSDEGFSHKRGVLIVRTPTNSPRTNTNDFAIESSSIKERSVCTVSSDSRSSSLSTSSSSSQDDADPDLLAVDCIRIDPLLYQRLREDLQKASIQDPIKIATVKELLVLKDLMSTEFKKIPVLEVCDNITEILDCLRRYRAYFQISDLRITTNNNYFKELVIPEGLPVEILDIAADVHEKIQINANDQDISITDLKISDCIKEISLHTNRKVILTQEQHNLYEKYKNGPQIFSIISNGISIKEASDSGYFEELSGTNKIRIEGEEELELFEESVKNKRIDNLRIEDIEGDSDLVAQAWSIWINRDPVKENKNSNLNDTNILKERNFNRDEKLSANKPESEYQRLQGIYFNDFQDDYSELPKEKQASWRQEALKLLYSLCKNTFCQYLLSRLLILGLILYYMTPVLLAGTQQDNSQASFYQTVVIVV
ncbi:MAG: hypothetical protein C5B43_00500 [Verrucomicrobia bacterium]|nr:MAG: hypothetical protein C5B43_00500 [Verrucomicrobiota bacterium]